MSEDDPSGDGQEPEEGQSLISHLIELRQRIIAALLAVGGVFCVMVWFANDLYSWFATPLIRALPQGSSMIATGVSSPFFAPVKLALAVSLFVAIPYVLYQVWAFVAPGLYRHERRLVLPLLISSSALFYAGAAFAYFAVFPLIFGYLVSTAPKGVAVMTDINEYLDFILTLFFAFGLAFEVPIATLLLIRTGLASVETLSKQRPYVILGAFIVGAVLTPPDVVSQTLLAVPMWLLFEIGLIFARFTPQFLDPDSEAQTNKNNATPPARE